MMTAVRKCVVTHNRRQRQLRCPAKHRNGLAKDQARRVPCPPECAQHARVVSRFERIPRLDSLLHIPQRLPMLNEKRHRRDLYSISRIVEQSSRARANRGLSEESAGARRNPTKLPSTGGTIRCPRSSNARASLHPKKPLHLIS